MSGNDLIPMFDPQLGLKLNPEAIRPSYMIWSGLEVQSVEWENILGHEEPRPSSEIDLVEFKG